MPRSLRDIRRKMKAIKATRQVTKAMELVAASKMRKAVMNAQQLRRYTSASWDILQRVASLNPDLHFSLQKRPVKNVLAVLFSSDRGLAGSLNSQLFRTAGHYTRDIKELATFQSVDFIAVGKKGQQFLARNGHNVVAAFPAFSNHPSFKDMRPVIRLISDSFASRQYDHVVLIYTDFVSPLVQEATVKVLLPFSDSTLKEMMAVGKASQKKNAAKDTPFNPASMHGKQYLLEPSPQEVVDAIIPLITEVQVYQALLEAVASEHSARMVAMRNASDNASDILDDLTLTYNQTRQANITSELAELSASKAALD
ncbi:MAG: synthase subunit gamma [Candidatus Peribacteria bacterium]|nr:synthase subunit gamma [Candidatus Peribacteria bacterium]